MVWSNRTDPFGYNPYAALYDTSWLKRFPTYGGSFGSVGLRPQEREPEPGVGRKVAEATVGGLSLAGQGIHAALWPIGLPKQYLMDKPTAWMARNVPTIQEAAGLARNLGGLEVPEGATTGQMAMDALLPGDPGGGGILEYLYEKTPLGLTDITNVAKKASLALLGAVGVPERQLADAEEKYPSLGEFILKNPWARQGVSALGEFGIDLATDPILYFLPGLAAGGRGVKAATKILQKFPVGVYAPEITRALASAVKTPGAGRWAQATAKKLGTTPDKAVVEALQKAGVAAGRAEDIARGQALVAKAYPYHKWTDRLVHGGFMGQMGLGGMETIGRAALAPEWTPERWGETVHGGLSLAMAAGIGVGHRRATRARHRVTSVTEKILPGMPRGKPMAVDLLPETDAAGFPVREPAEAWASEMAMELVEGVERPTGKRAGPGAVREPPAVTMIERMPEHLRPFAKQINEQAHHEAQAIQAGRKSVRDAQEEFPEGGEGVTVHPKGETEKYVINRDQDGQVIGVARLRKETTGEWALVTIGGGDILPGRPGKMGRLYEKLNELGVKRSDKDITYLGAKARRRYAEKFYPREVLEGRLSSKEFAEAQQAAKELYEIGLGDLVAGAVYSTEGGPGKIFYSQLRREIAAPNVQEIQRGDHWLAMLRKSKRQVTNQEMYWSGLGEFLKGKKRDRVSRKEIEGFLDENVVEVEEVTRGALPELTIEEFQAVAARGEPTHVEIRDRPEQIASGTLDDGRTVLPHVLENPDQYILRRGSFEDAQQGRLGTKFAREGLILPGGKKQREIVLTKAQPLTPATGGDAIGESFRRWAAPRHLSEATITAVLREGPGNSYWDQFTTQVPLSLRSGEAAPTFRGGHYPEANVLAHVRLNERTGPNGERVLFVEEIQSDWAQEGRRRGFTPDRDPARMSAINEELIRISDELGLRSRTFDEWLRETGKDETLGEMAQKELTERSGDLTVTEQGKELYREYKKMRGTEEERAVLSRRHNELVEERNRYRETGVPRGPFVERTKDWTKLVMRRVMKLAADEGYDKVAWTRGEQQVQRYESALRNAVDSLEWRKTKDGVHLVGMKDGNKVVDTVQSETDLSDSVGKAMAERIRQDPSQSGVITDEWIVRGPDGKEISRHKTEMQAQANKLQAAWDSDPQLVAAREAWKVSMEKVPIVKGNLLVQKLERRKRQLDAEYPGDELDLAPEEVRVEYARVTEELTALYNVGERAPAEGFLDSTVPEYAVMERAADALKENQNRVMQSGAPGKFTVERDVKGGLVIDDAGMAGYYDRILPGVVGKVTGAKVGETTFDYTGMDDALGPSSMLEDIPRELRTGKWSGWGRNEENTRTFDTEREAQAYAKKMGGDFGPQAAFTAHSVDITPEMRAPEARLRHPPLFATDKAGKVEAAANVQKLLVKLYPKNTHIKVEKNGTYTVTLPDKRTVVWNPQADHIEINLQEFERARGRKPYPGEKAVGATHRLSNAVVVELIEGVDARIAIHENWHVIKHLGNLTDKQLRLLAKKFKNEEAEADAYADWFGKGMTEPNTIFKRVYQGIRNVYQAVTGSKEAVFRAATEGLGRPRARPSMPAEARRHGKDYWKRLWGDKGPVGKLREVEGEKRGVGAPPRINSADGFLMLKTKLMAMAHEGEIGKNWYPDSSRMIMRLVAGNKKNAEAIAQLVGIYSPQNEVRPNLEHAVKAWNQYLAGEEITAGRYEHTNVKATQLLKEGKDWEGRKTNNFYGNLMLEIDPANADVYRKMVTADIHVLRAFGYDETKRRSGGPGDAQYDWIEKMVRDIAYDMGWDPHQVQAAIWTSQKYRSEVLPRVKPGETPPPIGKYDFTDAARDLSGHINIEAVPHPSTTVLPELQGATFEVRRAYTEGFVRDVLLDAQGQDRIAALVGFAIQKGYFAPGFYEGRGEPGYRVPAIMPKEAGGFNAAARKFGKAEWTVTKDLKGAPEAAKEIRDKGRYYLDHDNSIVYIDPKAKASAHNRLSREALAEITGDPVAVEAEFKRARGLDPSTIKQVERYAAAVGYIMRQKMVGYGRSFPGERLSDTNSLFVEMGRKLTDAETAAVMEAFAKRRNMPVDDPMMEGVFPLTLDDGFGIINYSGLDNATFRKVALGAVRDATRVDEVVNMGYHRIEGGVVENDWQLHRRGEAYAELAEGGRTPPGRPSSVLQGLDAIRAEADAYNSRFAAEQGWGAEPGPRGAEPGVGPAQGRVVEAPRPRGPPGVEDSKYATAVSPEAEPVLPGPKGGEPKPPGLPPRVETRVDNLQEAIEQQKKLGIPTKALSLSRDHRRTWESLMPEVRKKIIDWDDDAMFARVKRGRLDEVEVLALDAVVRGRLEAKDLAHKAYVEAKGTPRESETWKSYVQALADYVPLERAQVNDGTGTARALAARRLLMQAAETADRKFLRQALREFPDITEEAAAEMLRMFEDGDPRLSDAIRAWSAGKWKKWQTLLRAFLITPSSEFANTFGNTIVQGVEIADRAQASGVDWVVSRLKGTQRERYLGEVGAEMAGMMEAVPEALRIFVNERFVQIYKRAWKGESKPLELGRRLEYQVSPFRGKLGRLFATSLDALQAGDELFQAPIAQGELAARSYRTVKKKLGRGASTEELQHETLEMMQDVIQRPEKYPDLLNTIRTSTQRRLFRDKPWHMVDILREADRRWPWLTAVLPFVRTPANIARYAIHHSPLGFLTPDVARAIRVLKQKPVKGKLPTFEWEDAYGVKRSMGQGEAADVLAQRLVGTWIFGSALAAAAMGKLTGSGPADYKERRTKMETGWRPYSWVSNYPDGQKVYVPISRFDPVSQMLGVAADMVELPGQRDAQDIASKTIGSIGENFTNRMYLRGLMDWSEAMADPLRHGGQYVINTATMHIPRQLGRLAIAIDPVLRDPRPVDRGLGGFMERTVKTAARNIPWLSEQVPARYGPTGEPIVRPGKGVRGFLQRAFVPMQISPAREGKELEGIMAEIGAVPSEPRTYMTVQGEQIMLDREHIELLHRADRNAAHELRRLIRNPLFHRLPKTIEEGGNDSQEAKIEAAFRRYRSMARQMIFKSWSFQQSARQQLEEKRRQA